MKKPTTPFRKSQVAFPPNSTRKFGKSKIVKKTFDIYLTDIETGEETLAVTIFALTSREAIQIGREKLAGLPC